MRTDVQVGGKKVVAVALGEVETSLTHSLTSIRLAINRSKFGHTRLLKDFLQAPELQ